MAYSFNKIPEFGEEVQNLASVSVSNPKSQSNVLDFSSMISRMQALKGVVEKEEQRAYKFFNVSGIKELQAKIDGIMQTGIKKMFNFNTEEFNNMVQNLAQEQISVYDFSQPIIATVNNETFQEQLIDTLGIKEEAVISVEGFIRASQATRKVIAKSSDGGNNPKRFNFLAGKGLSRVLAEVKYDPNKKDKIEFKFSDFMPKEFQDRLENEYNVKFDNITKEDFSKQQVAKVLKQWVESNIRNTYRVKDLVLNELDTNLDSFDINKSAASVKGFLGEVATTAILKALCPNQSIIPTGTMKKVRTGQELPIDILLNDIGFQVKNYQFIKNKVSFGHKKEDDSMLMGNFITDRARVQGSIKQVLYALYGSYHYNQMIDGASGEYSSIRSSLEGKARESTEVFEGYIDNILKISDFFSSEDANFADKKLYFNTFFMIRDKLIPSSVILDNIITQLQNKSSGDQLDKILTSSFELQSLSSETPIYNGKHFGTHKVANKNLANKVPIHYTISIDMEKLLGDKAFQV